MARALTGDLGGGLDDRHQHLLSAARDIRAFLEPLWMDLHIDLTSRIQLPVASGMCRFTAEFLQRNASKLGLAGWRVCGGERGWKGPDGEHTHFWLSDGRMILCLTADQFGGDAGEVTLTTTDDPRFNDLGPVLATSVAAQAYIERTIWWDREWRDRMNASLPGCDGEAGQMPEGEENPFTVARLKHYLAEGAACFAIMFAGNAALRVFRNLGAGAAFLAGDADGKVLWDAAGCLPDNDPLPDVRLLTENEVADLAAILQESDLEAAADFASYHSALTDMARYARYDSMELELSQSLTSA